MQHEEHRCDALVFEPQGTKSVSVSKDVLDGPRIQPRHNAMNTDDPERETGTLLALLSRRVRVSSGLTRG
jgi:hypothetical protein